MHLKCSKGIKTMPYNILITCLIGYQSFLFRNESHSSRQIIGRVPI